MQSTLSSIDMQFQKREEMRKNYLSLHCWFKLWENVEEHVTDWIHSINILWFSYYIPSPPSLLFSTRYNPRYISPRSFCHCRRRWKINFPRNLFLSLLETIKDMFTYRKSFHFVSWFLAAPPFISCFFTWNQTLIIKKGAQHTENYSQFEERTFLSHWQFHLRFVVWSFFFMSITLKR